MKKALVVIVIERQNRVAVDVIVTLLSLLVLVGRVACCLLLVACSDLVGTKTIFMRGSTNV